MLFESPDSLRYSLHVITALATPLHIFGTYCILFKTPKAMGSVKWIMLNLHIWSMFLDYGFTVLVVPLIILPAIAGFPMGLLTVLFETPPAYQVCLILSVVFTVCVSIVFIFENRFYQLYAKNNYWKFLRIPFISLNYILCFVFIIPACLNIPEQETALKSIQELVPNLLPELCAYPIFVFATEYRFIVIPYALVVNTVFLEAMAFIGLIYWNMNKVSVNSTQSEKTVQMQRKFLKAIYVQAIVFMINLLAPIAYILFSIFTDFYNQGGNNLVVIVSALHGISSTSIMIWAHKPYREVFYSLWSKRSNRSTATVSMTRENRNKNLLRN